VTSSSPIQGDCQFPNTCDVFLVVRRRYHASFAQSVNVVLTTPDQTSLLAPQAPLTFASGTAAQLSININDTDSLSEARRCRRFVHRLICIPGCGPSSRLRSAIS